MYLHTPRVKRMAAIAALIGAAAAAHANPTYYGSLASFLGAVSQPGLDTFDGLAFDSKPSPADGFAGSYAYTVSTTSPSLFVVPSDTNAADRWLSTSNSETTLIFSIPVGGASAIGGLFFVTDDVGPVGGQTLIVTATDAAGSSTQTFSSTSASTFAGFVSTGRILSLTLTLTAAENTGVYATVNDLRLGMAAPVPEPETYALMLAGLGLLAWCGRRRAAG